ncbi:hypothetical protein H920_12592 [Fukomys damarensis]|uniref:Uncharacterized protein n=1 Tax=Fukomys damarensis TaxID=885580 RepID=A0A091DTA8_FUKDA|nr:hypothetical protein H920_12592 [Fukomys damarensis]
MGTCSRNVKSSTLRQVRELNVGLAARIQPESQEEEEKEDEEVVLEQKEEEEEKGEEEGRRRGKAEEGRRRGDNPTVDSSSACMRHLPSLPAACTVDLSPA